MSRFFNLKFYKICIFFSILLYLLVELNLKKKESNLKKIKQQNYNNWKSIEYCNPFRSKKLNYFIQIGNETFPKSLPLHLNKTINFECLNKSHNIKTILIWTPFYQSISYGYGLGKFQPFISNNCPISNCEITNDKSKINQSDYVMVHMRNEIGKLPGSRLAKQRWIFNLYESPVNSPNFELYRNFFNYTSTYRLNADFPRLDGSYKRFVWKENETFDPFFDYHKNKTKFATAVISNCKASSKRLDLINELKKYVQVDVFGNCGLLCPHDRKLCKQKLANEYKFFLSFENSLCNDYISEKFFEILRYPVIPVVLGLGNYNHFVPKSAYINVLDFSTIKNLADYLIYLDSNVTAYNSYFKWKKYAQFDYNDLIFSPLCDMCIKLHLEDYLGIENNIISDIDKLWSKKLNCKKADIKNNIYTLSQY